MPKKKPNETVEWGIMEVHRVLNRVYSARYKQEELSLTQAAAMGWLLRNGEMTQTELAKSLFLKRPATGDLIDYLETRGWIKRSPSPGDRRTWLVDLTEDGKQKLKTVNGVVLELRKAITAGLSDKELEAFMQGMSVIKNNLERMEEDKKP